jgi:2,4-diaminopentanoate dehydrogenase
VADTVTGGRSASGSGVGRTSPLRVIQCGTGLAGGQALAAILERPELKLAGLLVHSEKNDGRDAGSFVGRPDCGVRATRDVRSLIATPADIVVYMMLIPSLEDICAFLASGKNLVTTVGFMFPRWNNPEADRRLREACSAGNSSFFVSGINPGFVDEILPLTLSMLSRDWTTINITEYADCTRYPHKGIIDIMGFGYTPKQLDAGEVPDMKVMTDFFQASVAALAHSLGVELDEVRQTREFVLAKRSVDIAFGRIEAGSVAGQKWRWVGISQGRERIIQETFWIVAFDLGEGWPRTGEMEGESRWQVTIEGTPSLRCVFEPRRSFTDRAAGLDFNPAGVATAMAVINNLWAVVEAPFGLLTAADLPQPRWRGGQA